MKIATKKNTSVCVSAVGFAGIKRINAHAYDVMDATKKKMSALVNIAMSVRKSFLSVPVVKYS